MVVLKKVKASSLVEVLVASVVLVVVFTIAIFTLNSMLLSSTKNDLVLPQYIINRYSYFYPERLFEHDIPENWDLILEGNKKVVLQNLTIDHNIKRTLYVQP